MTLAPDHVAYTTPRETGEPVQLVSVVPDRKWRHLTLPPVDAPAKTDLALTRDIVLAHLHDGQTNGDPWDLTWAHLATDLDNPQAIPYQDAEALVSDYAHFARLNGGTDWDPQDAEDLHNQITRHLTAAGYREDN